VMQIDLEGGGRECSEELLNEGVDNLLVRIYFIIEVIRWTGLAPWEFELHLEGGARECSEELLNEGVERRRRQRAYYDHL